MMPAPDLSIIIVSYRTRELLEKCLASIFNQPSRLSAEVIVVDNDSRDGTAEMAREKFPDVTLIANDKNTGYSAANNQGIRASTGRMVLLLNPDTESNPAALEAMVDFLGRHPEGGAAGCQLLNSDGSHQASHFNIPIPLSRSFENASFYPRLTARLLRMPGLGPAASEPGVRRVDVVKGACLMIRREALDQTGLLDEDSFLYADDIDWCMRARRLGWSAYLLENHTVVHHGYASTDQEIYITITSSRRSALLLYRKHYPKLFVAIWTSFIYFEILYKYALNSMRARKGGASEKTKQKHRAYKTLFNEMILGRKESGSVTKP